MGDGLKRAKAAATATRQKPTVAPDGFPLTISFDSAKLRGEFVGWLSDGGGEQDFMTMVSEDRGSRLDIDYDSPTLIVVNEHER